MVKIDLEKLLLNIFWEDKIENKQNTIMSQMAMITIKSLMPNKIELGNRIDYKRFSEELKLLKEYKIDNGNNLLLDVDKDLYYNYKDETIQSRVLPLIISNTDYEIIEDEVIRNVLFTTGDIETLLEWIVVSRYLFLTIEQEENIPENLKEYIINFSQIDFLEKHKDYYRYDIFDSKTNYEVDFEKSRVAMISLLHGADMGKYKILKDLLGILDGKDAITSLGKIFVNAYENKDVDYDLDKNYKRMGAYIIKLRKSRIDPKDLEIKEYILPDVFKFKNDEVFFHSLLNTSKVIKKEIKEKSLTSLIQTRAGMYLFKRDPLD